MLPGVARARPRPGPHAGQFEAVIRAVAEFHRGSTSSSPVGCASPPAARRATSGATWRSRRGADGDRHRRARLARPGERTGRRRCRRRACRLVNCSSSCRGNDCGPPGRDRTGRGRTWSCFATWCCSRWVGCEMSATPRRSWSSSSSASGCAPSATSPPSLGAEPAEPAVAFILMRAAEARAKRPGLLRFEGVPSPCFSPAARLQARPCCRSPTSPSGSPDARSSKARASRCPRARSPASSAATASGKTTLFRAIAGEISPDAGSISLPKGARIGRVEQEAPSGPQTLIETVLAADSERAALLHEAEHATDPHRIAELHARLTDIDAHSAEARAARILAGLGFDAEAQARPCSDFSGGWRMRVALAALLFAEPDLLLLDEPTNYLDLEGTLWLERFLARYPRTVIVISHDRDLLNTAVDFDRAPDRPQAHLSGAAATIRSSGSIASGRRCRRSSASSRSPSASTCRRSSTAFATRPRRRGRRSRG